MSFRVASISTNVARNLARSSVKNSGIKNHVVSVSELTRSQLGFMSYNRRFIDTNSWAKERLEMTGEKLDQGPELPLTEVDLKTILATSPKLDKLIDEVLSLNVLEMNQFTRAIQRRLGFTDAMMFGGGGGGSDSGAGAGGGAGGAAAAAPVAEKEKEHFDVKLGAVDAASKIKIIKEVRAITGLGLKEAKDLVEKAPVVVKAGLKKDEAEAIIKTLTDAGGKVEMV